MMVRSEMRFTLTVGRRGRAPPEWHCSDLTGGAASAFFAVVLAVLAPATIVAEAAAAEGGDSPSQFSIFNWPSITPPPGSTPVSAVKSEPVWA